MIKNKRILLLSAAAASALLLAGCSVSGGSGGGSGSDAEECTPAHPDLPTLTAGTLKVGVQDTPPTIGLTGPDGYEGIDADIVNGFAEVECLTVEPVTVSPNAAVTSVEQGRIDVATGGWYRTEERQEVVTSGYPMYLDAYVTITQGEGYPALDDMEGLNIGTIQGYSVIDSLKEVFPGKVKVYPEQSLLAEDLKSGRVDVVFDVATSSVMYGDEMTVTIPESDERVPETVEAAQAGLPFNKDAEELIAAWDEYIIELHESGEMKTILEKWKVDPAIADVGEPRLLQ